MRYRVMIVASGLLLAASLAPAAEKKARLVDLFWTAPDAASYGIGSIAMLPVATYDDNLEARRFVETAAAQAFRGTGYRWLSATSARDYLQRAGGDSLLLATRTMLTKLGRVDSLEAPLLSRTLRTRALLSLRVEAWDRVVLEPTQAGRPYTTVRLSAALVDSTGRLLWTASGTETLEGQYRDPGQGVVGMKSSGLSDQPMTNTAGAPAYTEVLNKLLARWTPQFPPKPASPAAPDSAR
jgi:hypothetical protein